MKKILFTLLVTVFLTNGITNNGANAQTDTRTTTTKIADLLAQLPAQSSLQFEKNMKEIGALGETGFTNLILSLNNEGASKHLVEYAITGFTAFSTKPGQENYKNLALNAYSNALPNILSAKNKGFIISQFELIGNDSSVQILEQYLNNEQLVDETSRALAKINTPSAINALSSALKSNSIKIKLSAIEALGHTHSPTATGLIIANLNGNDVNLKKASYFALANLGHSLSESVLLKAAENVGFKYDPSNAVSSLIVYTNQLSKSNKNKASELAKTILLNAKNADQVNIKIAALEILSRTTNDQKIYFDALKDSQLKYRIAAIQFATPYLSDNNAKLWLKELKNADPLTKVAIIDMFANKTYSPAINEIFKWVASPDKDVKVASVNAVVKLGNSVKLPELINLMNKGWASDIEIIADGIMKMQKEGVPETIAAYIKSAKPEVKVALINILAAKAANDQFEFIYEELNNENPEVKNAAFQALKYIASSNNSQNLYDLINKTSDKNHLVQIQEAIIAVNKDIKDINQQSALIREVMDKAAADKKPLYFKILASLGDSNSLAKLIDIYAQGTDLTKSQAIQALSNWKDSSSAQELIKIARNTKNTEHLALAVNGYLQLIRKSQATPDQRLLLLRNAFEVAPNTVIQQQILKDLTQSKTYQTILFAGKYLDDPSLQQSAAQTVMNITMAGKYSGEIIRELLNKTIAVLTGPDSDYQKEGLRKYLSEMENGEGFVKVFNGKDLTGWKGLVGDPIKRSKMTATALQEAQQKADAAALESWKVINGELHFQSHGDNLATIKKYGDIEMLVDWKIIDDKKGEGDAGIYLRGTPQVQIWDLARTNVGAQVGSGGLYNNQKNPSKPLLVADNPLDEWNTFRILMIGDRVTVYLNGKLVTDNVILENYWDRSLPIFAEEQIELQAHGSPVAYRDIYIREIPRPKPFELSEEEKKEGFKVLFDGTNMHHWVGNTTDYVIENGNMAIRPKPGKGSGGNLFTKEEFSDFVFRFEFQLTPGANNGLGIRAPLEGDAAYVGMELQILDNDAPIYKNLAEYQYHGSIYGTIPAKRGFLKPVGEWNYQEVIAKGSKIKVILNGNVILDGDIEPFKFNGTPDKQNHPGLKRTSGHIGFLGHGSPIQFRNIRIKDLSKDNTQPSNSKPTKKTK